MSGERGRLLDDSKGSGLTMIIGAVLMIQGFGAAISIAVRDTGWGLLAVAANHWDLPEWSAIAVGVAGVAVALVGLLWRVVD